MEPFQVFPQLVWKEIFDKIEDDTDKLSFLRAHSDFRELFKKKYVELGFLSALPILMDYFQGERSDWSWELNRERRETILACRLVSRKCSQSVDNWMNSHWEDENKINPPLILCKENESNNTELWTRPQVEEFAEHFGTVPDGRMPILSRSVHVGIPLYENEDGRWDPNYVEDLQQELEDNERRNEILTTIGAHVRSLTVDVTLSDTPGDDNVEIVRERIEAFKSVLELVPNLKSLSTSWEPIFPEWEEEEGVLDFPDLPQLIHLSLSPRRIRQEGEVFDTDLAPFEKYFQQLIHLQLFTLYGWKDEYMEAGRFPKLRHLQLLNIYPAKYNHRRKLLTMCRKLFAPNLETVSVRIIGYAEEGMDTKADRWIRKLIVLLNKLFEEENGHWHACLEGESELKFWRVRK